MQSYARANSIAIDELYFKQKVTNYADPASLNSCSDSGAYIYGLFIEGCKFDK